MNSNPGSLLMYGWSSFTKNDKGIPCMFPDDDVSGVLISACASTQTTTCSGSAKEWPKMEPMAMLWSPPRAKQVLPDLMTLYTSAAICQRGKPQLDQGRSKFMDQLNKYIVYSKRHFWQDYITRGLCIYEKKTRLTFSEAVATCLGFLTGRSKWWSSSWLGVPTSP